MSDILEYATTGKVTPKPVVAPPTPAAEVAPVEAAPPQQYGNGPHVVTDATTKQQLVEDSDGSIWLHGVGGELKAFHPQEAGQLLANKRSGYWGASPDEVKEHVDKQKWNDADLNAKVDFYGRRTVSTIADAVTAVPRLAAFIGSGGNSKVDESLSGEAVVRKLDAMLAGEDIARKEAEGARELEGGAPMLGKLATDVGGLVLGGGLAEGAGALAKLGGAAKLGAGIEATSLAGGGKLVGSAGEKIAKYLGVDAAKAAKLGQYADTIVQGAAIGNTQAAHEAWIKDEALTSEAQWNAIGLGALLGGATHGAVDALGAVPRAGLRAAERVFGKVEKAAGAEAATSAQELAEGVTGIKQPEGIGAKLKDMSDWIKSKVQQHQAEKSGVALKDVEEFGAFGKRFEEVEKIVKNRDAYVKQGTQDLQGALETLHAEGSLLADNVVDVAMKREHMARLLESSERAPIMQLAVDKAAEFEAGLENLNATVGRGRAMFGEGGQLANIKATYEDAIDRLRAAEHPADVTSALDQFKRSAQKAKVNAQRTASKVAGDIEQNQAFARADLMNQVSENTRSLLENDKLFGDFGVAQRETNARMNRAIESDKFVKQQFFDRTGDISGGPDFGAAKYQINPAKIEAYLNHIGTNKVALIDDALRDNIDARKQLAEVLGKHYGADQMESVAAATASADKAMGVLKHMDDTVRITNINSQLMAAEAGAKGHGLSGMTLASMAGHFFASHPVGAAGYAAIKAITHVLENPMAFTGQAIQLRNAAIKLNDSVGANVKSALARVPSAAGSGKIIRNLGAKAAASTNDEKYQQKYLNAATRISEFQMDPEKAIHSVTNLAEHIEHPGVKQALMSTSMNALGFLASKLPQPLYKDSVASKSDINNVSDTARDTFMRYVQAVNSPRDFFQDLATGSATPEQAETARTLMPQAFGIAQQEAIMQFSGGKVKASYQVRLNVQRMLGLDIEPIASPMLQSFISQSVQQSSQSQPSAPSKPKSSSGSSASSAASAIASPLSNLKV